jgi:hypothetical protein
MWRCIYTYPMDDTEDRSIKVATNEEAAAVGAGVHSWRHWGFLGSGRTWMLPSRCLARRIKWRIMAAIAATERRPEPWGPVLSYPATTRTALGVFRSSHCRWTWWRASWLLLQSGCQMRLLWLTCLPASLAETRVTQRPHRARSRLEVTGTTSTGEKLARGEGKDQCTSMAWSASDRSSVHKLPMWVWRIVRSCLISGSFRWSLWLICLDFFPVRNVES